MTEASDPVILHPDPHCFLDPMPNLDQHGERPGGSFAPISSASSRRIDPKWKLAVPWVLFLSCAAVALAQGNYEIQVYPSETQDPGTTMIELHSNYTIEGSKGFVNGVYGTQDQLHETVEITEGITDWFETGFYIFTSANPNQGGWQWVGDHIRPRARIPESWHWPVGVSLSLEFGYQRYIFSPDTWTLEIRPIIDKQIGRFYLAFNPTLDRSFHGPSVSQGVVFSPNFKVGYDFTKVINAGFEYYGSLGPLGNFDPLVDQQQQIFPVVDLSLSPKWEFNFGVGWGLTRSTDGLIVKMIIGRRFGGGNGGK